MGSDRALAAEQSVRGAACGRPACDLGHRAHAAEWVRWRDCPPQYGPCTTIYNRFHRWSRQGVWFAVFEALT
jgi:transposase